MSAYIPNKNKSNMTFVKNKMKQEMKKKMKTNNKS